MDFKLVSRSCLWWLILIELKWTKYPTLHSWGQRLFFATLVDDSSQGSWEHVHHMILKALSNKQLNWSKNSYWMGYWKFILNFEEFFLKTLLLKTNLHIHFLFDVWFIIASFTISFLGVRILDLKPWRSNWNLKTKSILMMLLVEEKVMEFFCRTNGWNEVELDL